MALKSLAAKALKALKDAEAAAEKARKATMAVEPKRKPTRAPAAPAIIKNVSGSAARSSTSFNVDRDKLRQQYPDVGESVTKINEKGKPYTAKGTSPEAEAVAKARAKIRKQMQEEGYSPLFAVEKRTHVDPSNYPLIGNTLTDAIPATSAKQAEYAARADTPETRSNLSRAYEASQDDPLARDWYAMQQLEQAFIDELGPVAGRDAFRRRFAEGMAATTGGADPTANLLTTAYGNFMNQRGLAIPSETYNLPHPIGGRYIGGNIDQFNRLIVGNEPLTAKANPKRFNFAGDFMGHLDRATIDEQMSGMYEDLVQREIGAPPVVAYGLYERPVHDLAARYGVTPARFQEVAWAGAKGVGGKPMISHVNDAIERTSRLTGASPEEVLRYGIIRSERPTFAVGGSVDAKQLAAKYDVP